MSVQRELGVHFHYQTSFSSSSRRQNSARLRLNLNFMNGTRVTPRPTRHDRSLQHHDTDYSLHPSTMRRRPSNPRRAFGQVPRDLSSSSPSASSRGVTSAGDGVHDFDQRTIALLNRIATQRQQQQHHQQQQQHQNQKQRRHYQQRRESSPSALFKRSSCE